MITTSSNEVVEKFGTGVEHSFKIKSTAKAFRILSSNLYSDKILAIVRELSCNAYDSHIQAKTEKPFSIHLPNNLEPWFSIRDYGTGLSEHDIVEIFTTYFESTKDGSNDYIGCLGLGSKTPFSYTDSFSVISYFNGIKYDYTMFINEEGLPRTTLNGTSETGEQNGLKITMGVLAKDFWYFKASCEKVFKYFKSQPEIGGQDITIQKPVYILNGKSWGILSGSGSVKFVMGNVAYDLNNFSDETLTEDQKSVFRLGIDIYVDIGSIDVQASRESISFDKNTKEFIHNKIVELYCEINQEMQNKIDAIQHLYDVKLLVADLKSSFPYFKFSQFTFKNEKFDFNPSYTLENTEKDLVMSLLVRKGRRSNTIIESKMEHLRAYTHNIFYIADVCKHNKSRFKKLYWSTDSNPQERKHIIVRPLPNQSPHEAKKLLIKTLGMNPHSSNILNVSSLPFEPRAKRNSLGKTVSGVTSTSTTSNQNTVFKKVVSFYDTTYEWWGAKDTICEMHDGLYNTYVVLQKRNAISYVGSYEDRTFADKIRLLKDLKIKMPIVYGVKDSKKEAFIEKYPNIISFDIWFKGIILSYIVDNNLCEEFSFAKNYRAQKNTDYKYSIIEQFEKFSPFLKDIKAKDKKSQETYDKALSIFESANFRNINDILDFLERHCVSGIIENINDSDLLQKFSEIVVEDIMKKYILLETLLKASSNMEKYLQHYFNLVNP